jgi:hypothetical protein
MAKRKPIRVDDVYEWRGGQPDDSLFAWQCPECKREVVMELPPSERWQRLSNQLGRCNCNPPRRWKIYAEGT